MELQHFCMLQKCCLQRQAMLYCMQQYNAAMQCIVLLHCIAGRASHCPGNDTPRMSCSAVCSAKQGQSGHHIIPQIPPDELLYVGQRRDCCLMVITACIITIKVAQMFMCAGADGSLGRGSSRVFRQKLNCKRGRSSQCALNAL